MPRELQADVPGAPKDAAGSFFLTAGGSRLSPKPSAAVARIVPAALVPEVSAQEAKVELPSVAAGKEPTIKVRSAVFDPVKELRPYQVFAGNQDSIFLLLGTSKAD